MSQQTDEGYSEDPLNTASDPSAFAAPYKSRDAESASDNPLSGASPAQLKGWMSTHIASLPTELRAQLALELLDNLPTSLVAEIVEKMAPRLYIDFIRHLPAEICLKILGFLDPVSLLSVAQTCRAWYSLALDRTLWQTLYHYEGWKVVAHEIAAAEEMVNRRSEPGSMHRQKSEEDGHTHKKRAVSLEDDEDQLMADAEASLVEEPQQMDMDKSLFGGPLRSSMTPAFRDLNMQGSNSSSSSFAKGKAVDKGKGRAIPDSPTSLLPSPGNISNSGLWVWDPSSRKQKINWQYLYAMRRKLETNWEQGNFKNFQLPHPDHPEEGHDGECIYSLQYNEDFLVSGSRDKTLRIWNLATRRLVRKPLIGHIGSVLCLQFDSDPDEDIIVSGSSDSDVIIWRFSTGEIIQRLTHAHRESVLNVKFDKRILATCSKDRTIKIFNRRPMKAGEPGYVFPVPTTLRNYGYDASPLDQQPTLPPFTMIGVLEGHGAAVNAVQIVDNEVVSASGDRHIKVWNWQTGVCKRTLLGHNKGIACVQYDGKRIVSGSSDNEVKVFDRETGIETASLRAHTDLVRTVQAGFGDLPWSAEEDAAEARKADQAYMKALNDGEISAAPQRGRSNTATGNSDASEIRAYGSKLPPGGGGGRRWGRIVSGSYDKTIIIWRRDKMGKWKPQHHLKQEEAAQRTAAPNSRPPPPGPPGPGVAPGAPGAGGNGSNGGSGGNSRSTRLVGNPSRQTVSAALNAARAQRGMGGLSPAQHHGETAASGSGSGSSSRATAGSATPSASSRTSGSRPRFSRPHSSANASSVPIPPSVQPVEPVGDMVHAASPLTGPLTPAGIAGFSRMIDGIVPQGTHVLQQALNSHPAMLSLQTQLQAAIDREPSPFVRSQLRQVVSATTVRMQVAQARTRAAQGFQALVSGDNSTINASSDDDAGVGASASAASLSNSTTNNAATPGGTTAVVAGSSASTPHTPAQINGSVAGPPPPGAVGGPAGVHRAHQAHAPEVGMPTRIYKLQFDARRIICCSQTSVIVGWDFCNGDPALEEVARFFATVE